MSIEPSRMIFLVCCTVQGLLLPASDLRLLDHPVELEVVLVAQLQKQILKQLPQIRDVRLLLELHPPTVV